MTLVHRIVSAVAEREGVEPEALETPLHEAIDTEVLSALERGSGDREPNQYPVVEFVYYRYTIWVDGNGNITVSGQPGSSVGSSTESRMTAGGPTQATPTEMGSTETLYRSLDDISGERSHRKTAMQKAADVIAARERPFEERLEGLLKIVRTTLDLESATLSYINDAAYVFEAVDVSADIELENGEVIALQDTVCRRVVKSEQALVLRDILVDAPELTGRAVGLASYIGVPVFVDGEVYGTFCFYDSEPRDDEFSEWEQTFVELLSRWVSSELERRNRERTIKAATTERPSSRS